MSKISVIVPVYNTERYLASCLDSLLAQTFQDWEAICVDDGSTDECKNILQQYGLKDKRLKIIAQKNKGLSSARNAGLDYAKGEYVFFLDSDDIIPEYALEMMLKIAEITNVPVVASESSAISNKAPRFNYQVFRHPLTDFVKNNRIFSSAWNKLYRADILKTHRFIKGIYFEDWPFLTTLFGEIDSFATTKTPCYIYREEGTSITRSEFTRKKVDSYLAGIWSVYDFYKKRPDLTLAQKRIIVAVKMMVNKAYKENNKELAYYTLTQLNHLFEKRIIHKYQLPLKIHFRLWKMRHIK